MQLYTTDLHFRGGTYLKQIWAESVLEIQIRLDDEIDWAAIAPAPKTRGFRLTDSAAVAGLVNVWCLRGQIDRSPAIIYVVATVE